MFRDTWRRALAVLPVSVSNNQAAERQRFRPEIGNLDPPDRAPGTSLFGVHGRDANLIESGAYDTEVIVEDTVGQLGLLVARFRFDSHVLIERADRLATIIEYSTRDINLCQGLDALGLDH